MSWVLAGSPVLYAVPLLQKLQYSLNNAHEDWDIP